MQHNPAKETATIAWQFYCRLQRQRRFVVLTGSLVAWLAIASAPTASAAGPSTVAVSGANLYRRYCASCHGSDGKGNGPATPAMVTPPTDLTMLARHNAGKFDLRGVIAVIDGRRNIAAHGSREMPVWGAVFDEELKGQPYSEYTTLLRAKTLAEYLATIQQ